MFGAPCNLKALLTDWREFLQEDINKTWLSGAKSVSLGKADGFQWAKAEWRVLLMLQGKVL